MRALDPVVGVTRRSVGERQGARALPRCAICCRAQGSRMPTRSRLRTTEGESGVTDLFSSPERAGSQDPGRIASHVAQPLLAHAVPAL